MRPANYWTKEKVFEESQKYTTRSEFCKGSSSAYAAAWKNHWLDEMTWLKENNSKPRGYWTKEKVFEESHKYTTRKELEKGCISAYAAAWKNHWLDEMTWLKENNSKPMNYWTKERVFEEVHKYTTRKKFHDGCVSAYNAAQKNNWLDEMTWFKPGKQYNSMYCIYVYEDNINIVAYVGLTCDKIKRHLQHSNCYDKSRETSVHKYYTSIGKDIPEPIYLEDNLSAIDAKRQEDYWIKQYSNKGYKMLNIAKAGSLGGYGRKWSKNKVFEESKKYTTRNEFRKGCGGAYYVARINHWLVEMTWLEPGIRRRPTKWTKEKALEKSRKYATIMEFKKNCNSAYYAAWRHHWLDELFPKK